MFTEIAGYNRDETIVTSMLTHNTLHTEIIIFIHNILYCVNVPTTNTILTPCTQVQLVHLR